MTHVTNLVVSTPVGKQARRRPEIVASGTTYGRRIRYFISLESPYAAIR